MAKVSVIIPCYNQGEFIDEAVDSVLAQTYQDFEIIVVNDGSTDEFTISKLTDYEKPKTRVLHTNNQGLSAARNTGISKSEGQYILPLDADDKLDKNYLEEALDVLEKDSAIGIVYCKAQLFGEQTGLWELPDYSYENILMSNMIFCTALFRRTDFERTKGYDPAMIYGWEDWDLWLSLIKLGLGVFQIQKVLFYYRIRKESMVRILDDHKKTVLYKQLFKNHLELYISDCSNPIEIFRENRDLNYENNLLKGQILSLHETLKSIKLSHSYRLGNIMVRPFSTILKFINFRLK